MGETAGCLSIADQALRSKCQETLQKCQTLGDSEASSLCTEQATNCLDPMGPYVVQNLDRSHPSYAVVPSQLACFQKIQEGVDKSRAALPKPPDQMSLEDALLQGISPPTLGMKTSPPLKKFVCGDDVYLDYSHSKETCDSIKLWTEVAWKNARDLFRMDPGSFKKAPETDEDLFAEEKSEFSWRIQNFLFVSLCPGPPGKTGNSADVRGRDGRPSLQVRKRIYLCNSDATGCRNGYFLYWLWFDKITCGDGKTYCSEAGILKKCSIDQ